MPLVITDTIPNAVKVFPGELFFRKYAALMEDTIYPRITKVMPSTRLYEEGWEVSGLATFTLKEEGTAVAYQDPVQGSRTRIVNQTFASGVRQTMELMEDDQWGILTQLPAELADSGRDHQERLAHGPYNDAFSGSSFTGLDGLAMCVATHTSLNGGGARSNLGVPPVDLSTAGLEALMELARMQKDESGRQINFTPTQALVHGSKRWALQRILATDQEPFSNENTVNVIASKNSGITGIDSPYLTNEDAYFLLDQRFEGVRYQDRKSMSQDTSKDSDTFDQKTTAHYRAGVGFFKWESTYGMPSS